MSRAGRAAGLLDLLAGAWGAVFAYTFPGRSSCPTSGCPIAAGVLQPAILVLGLVLVVDGFVCLYGLRRGFYLGVALSAVSAGLVLFEWAGRNPGLVAVGFVLVSLLAVIGDLVAIWKKSGLPEQGNPMNLPVFG
jgi:hypothetical protein